MIIAAVSDLHQRYRFVKDWPHADVLVVAGDMTCQGTLPEIAMFHETIAATTYRYIIVVAGNHDFGFEQMPTLAIETLIGSQKDRIIYLKDSGITIDGVKFWGSPWQLRYGRYAFNIDTDKELKRYWDMVPADTDVLITHSPPHGLMDMVEEVWWQDGKPVKGQSSQGSKTLRQAVRKLKPQAHIFGHIHEGYGSCKINKTQYVNGALCLRGELNPIQVITIKNNPV